MWCPFWNHYGIWYLNPLEPSELSIYSAPIMPNETYAKWNVHILSHCQRFQMKLTKKSVEYCTVDIHHCQDVGRVYPSSPAKDGSKHIYFKMAITSYSGIWKSLGILVILIVCWMKIFLTPPFVWKMTLGVLSSEMRIFWSKCNFLMKIIVNRLHRL